MFTLDSNPNPKVPPWWIGGWKLGTFVGRERAQQPKS